MPKKHTFNFRHLTNSSTPKNVTTNNGDDGTQPTVNERLNELRKLEGKDAAAKKRALAESVNQRSVPPEVRGILGLAESAPPKPKVGVRFRDRLRTPGPAPPRSWTVGWSVGGVKAGLGVDGRRGRRSANALDRSRPEHLLRFDALTADGNHDAKTAVPSLVHLALKATADSWYLFDPEDYPALADIPLRLRARLLTYIGFYGAPIAPRELQAVLQGNDRIRKLDLGGLIGYEGLSLKRLARLIEDDRRECVEAAQVAVQDSWDAEDDSKDVLHPNLGLSRFASLTHLCLSHPGIGATWKDLLAMIKLTPQVTHLSLAYWPRPTLTPNLATTTVASRTGDVSAGGSHYYSALDQDMTEPAALLRQLSLSLLCLQWLDLEGCQAWISALPFLAGRGSGADNPYAPPTAPSQNDNWLVTKHSPPQVFTTNWKNLTYIRCAQGWLPSFIGVSNLSERHENVVDRLIADDFIKYLKRRGDQAVSYDRHSQDTIDVEKKKARLWLEAENRGVFASIQMNSYLRAAGRRPVEMDFGWVRRYGSSVTT